MNAQPATHAITPAPPPPLRSPLRLLALISGGGRTLMNIMDRIDAGELNARVVRVVASRPCSGADRARVRNVPTEIIAGEIPAPRLEAIFRECDADLGLLCGYLKFLHVPTALRGRFLNIHPALLPKFGGKGMYGHHVHQAVLAAREPVSGCTVHIVDDQYDHGATLLQQTVPVLEGDTPDTLAARVFEAECTAYPQALAQIIARGRVEP